jgi:hypothetical protein
MATRIYQDTPDTVSVAKKMFRPHPITPIIHPELTLNHGYRESRGHPRLPYFRLQTALSGRPIVFANAKGVSRHKLTVPIRKDA